MSVKPPARNRDLQDIVIFFFLRSDSCSPGISRILLWLSGREKQNNNPLAPKPSPPGTSLLVPMAGISGTLPQASTSPNTLKHRKDCQNQQRSAEAPTCGPPSRAGTFAFQLRGGASQQTTSWKDHGAVSPNNILGWG
mmetsp:Transcript_56557/g.100816  ORF Transcript_56557/g.100816 Transcript_56557/m.100816 type:complete len:138 (+) Transcript_56557:205-618(+)